MMYGSIRTCCAAASELNGFTKEGIKWGDRTYLCHFPKLLLTTIVGMGRKFRHAGFSSDEVGKVVPAELYCGRDASDKKDD